MTSIRRLALPVQNWLYWKFEPHGLIGTMWRKVRQLFCAHPTWSGFIMHGYASRSECDACHKVIVK